MNVQPETWCPRGTGKANGGAHVHGAVKDHVNVNVNVNVNVYVYVYVYAASTPWRR